MKLAYSRLLAFLFFAATAALADPIRGVTITEGTVYLNPDAGSEKLSPIKRGREVVQLDTSREWVHVLATVDPEHDITGWIRHRDIILTTDPNGDQLLYGEAVDCESEASRRRGRKGAAQDALWIYYRLAEQYPQSPLAGPSLYRAADIRWQLEKIDAFSLPSARERDPGMRHEIDDEWIRQVEKKFPHTKWADLAAWDTIDNKICGEWQGDPKCPEKESDIYLKYVEQHPQSPKAAEALYEAAWRQGALVDMYKSREEKDKAQKARNKATEIAHRITSEYSQTDWGPRAQRLVYMLEQEIPTYGNATD